MASNSNHLDATSGREVVYCHNCEHEWYRSDRSAPIDCPRCHNDCTEIISPDNDPRNLDDSDSLSDFERRRLRHLHQEFQYDSDPDEADIEEHIHRGPEGLYARRRVYRSPNSEDRSRTRPDSSEDIIRRFTEMLGEIGGPVGRSGPDTLFSNNSQPHVRYQRISGPGYTGSFGTFSITTSGPGPGMGRSPNAGSPGARGGSPEDPFQSVFGNIIGNVGTPLDQDGARAAGPNGARGPGPENLSAAIQHLLGIFINPHAVHGDAVYSQEALDRIMTNLMEANPQSNAAAPASDDAIAKLPRKNLDEKMLGPELKGECTICIDDMKLGDEVVVLPCKHWFHETCVVLWLKQHNTCPICRAAVDGDRAGEPAADGESQDSQAGPSTASASMPGPSNSRSAYLRQNGEARLNSIRNLANPHNQEQTSQSNSSYPPPMYSPPGQSGPSSSGGRPRDGSRGSSNNGGPLNWLRDQFRERRS
ncbi:hypothetical protein F5B20DRAFT_585818 [Whalleya microplaca]|nr:hypothetical protein F5B20DRAFT_585818 [Whalleya microplaca]